MVSILSLNTRKDAYWIIAIARQPSAQLRRHTEQLQHLASKLADIGIISAGTVRIRHMSCGKSGCRCQADRPQLHGPYWQWSQSIGGRTQSRLLSEAQAALYQQWIDNRRRLRAIVAEMEAVSAHAAEIVLQQAADKPTSESTT